MLTRFYSVLQFFIHFKTNKIAVSEQVFNPWIAKELQADRLTAEDFSEDKIIESFMQEVVEKIKQKHEQVFTVLKKSKN